MAPKALQAAATTHSHGPHESHTRVRNRLKRANGHLTKIVQMVDEERGCPEVAQQLQAVIRALEAAKRTLIYDHIDNCLEEAIDSAPQARRRTVDEFKEISKYL